MFPQPPGKLVRRSSSSLQRHEPSSRLVRVNAELDDAYFVESTSPPRRLNRSTSLDQRDGGIIKPMRPTSGRLIKRQNTEDMLYESSYESSTSPTMVPPHGSFFPPNLNSDQVTRTGSMHNLKTLSPTNNPERCSTHNLKIRISSGYGSSDENLQENSNTLGNNMKNLNPPVSSSPRRLKAFLSEKTRSGSVDSALDSEDCEVLDTEDDELLSFQPPLAMKKTQSQTPPQTLHQRRLGGSQHRRSNSQLLPVAHMNAARIANREFNGFNLTRSKKERAGSSRMIRRNTDVNLPVANKQLSKVGSFTGRPYSPGSPRGRLSPKHHKRSFRYEGVSSTFEDQPRVEQQKKTMVRCRSELISSPFNKKHLRETNYFSENVNENETTNNTTENNNNNEEDAINKLVPKHLRFQPPPSDEGEPVFKFALWEKKSQNPVEEQEEPDAPQSPEVDEDVRKITDPAKLSVQTNADTLSRLRTNSLSAILRRASSDVEQKLTDSRDSSSGASENSATTGSTASSGSSPRRKTSPRSGKNLVDAAKNAENPTIEWSRGKLIGKGTYGEVFIALDCATGKQFAVKRISKGGRGMAQMMKIQTEINVMKSLVHDNIVQYLGSRTDVESGVLEIFLEYVTGGSLALLIKEHGALSPRLCARFASHIVQGVSYLHSMGIIHRDIKGANVLLTDTGVAKLADFGTARELEILNSNDETLTSIRGSIPWMSPEMIRQTGHGYGSDIWSLGCTVLEICTGRTPWPSLTDHVNALFVIGNTTTPPPIPDNYHSGTELGHFLSCCFKINPDERSKAGELLEHPFISDLIEK